MFGRLRRLLPAAPAPTLSSADAYARWAASYQPYAHNPFMQAEQDAVLALMPDLAGRVVLDLACGTGRYSRLAAERGARLTLGLDSSLAMLRANAQPLRALAHVEALPLPAAAVDVVICALALGHLPSLAPALAEISRVLRAGGTALVSDFHPFAFLSGARRTFTAADGAVYAVEHYPHLYSDYHRAGQSAGLVIDAVTEIALPNADAGRRPSPALLAVLVLRLVKTDV
ncbi:MAG: class I SAM-dependent methyltransferase [Aggregatilineales bacterium]